MDPKIQSGVLAAFTADALALGAHWVYDVSLIKKRYGRLDYITAPEIAPFHKGKVKGSFTHYGDQMFLLLESLSNCSGFDPDDFATQWQAMFANYRGYMDTATKKTLAKFKDGKSPKTAGSDSTDLGGAARMVPLALFYADAPQIFIEYADLQTAMTHNHPQVRESARFFAAAAIEALKGADPVALLKAALKGLPEDAAISRLVVQGLDSVNAKTEQAISNFGQMCETQAALPGTIHLIAKYPDDLETALIENIMAGGDSSARGILCAFILGICNGMDAIPARWLDDMRETGRIRAMAGM
ncbi:MAG: ADP-ribosylglycohydrolase family protein [Proteobacteria bacterium]|nr:ADP-ribosylglycohydrolase family protein [Pseudomonadota bacterium]MBU1386800.1 ADP-ribosylglycohydrolase family protein [Pseudomonadota bacterium]MBU1544744.1 ADP-ribosylglycohydrolase family protein [Pseudomonadota bacterium]MBU2481913.1 ADP-ribosylglycohydrolase family protein [Pseudomonadota bacterium]